MPCSQWAREQGCIDFASDCELYNTESAAFHEAIGFDEVNRVIAYVKRIDRRP